MMVYSCVAVHRWRMMKKDKAVSLGRFEGQNERRDEEGRI
jgi:hypothetical protein